MYTKIDSNSIVLPKLTLAMKPTSNNACNTIKNLDPSDFESFILEYLMFVNKSIDRNSLIAKTGGTNDLGIDIYFENGKRIEYYQCKRYATPLKPNEVIEICMKIISNEFNKYIKHPSIVHIVSSNGLTQNSLSLFTNKKDLQKKCLEQIKNNFDLQKFINNYDFKVFKYENLEEIVHEYMQSEFCTFRFQTSRPITLNRIKPKTPSYNKMTYSKQLSTFLSKELINAANENYYSALSLKYTIENLFNSSSEFDQLKEEIYQSVFETNKIIIDKTDRFIKTIDKATKADINAVYVNYELHMVYTSDKKGICHFLVNEGRIKWD